MNKKEKQLTTVKVDPDLFQEFKINGIKYKFSFTKLVERSMDLYINDESFRKLLNNHRNLDFHKEN